MLKLQTGMYAHSARSHSTSVMHGLVLQAKFKAMPPQEGDRRARLGCAKKEGLRERSGEGQTFTFQPGRPCGEHDHASSCKNEWQQRIVIWQFMVNDTKGCNVNALVSPPTFRCICFGFCCCCRSLTMADPWTFNNKGHCCSAAACLTSGGCEGV